MDEFDQFMNFSQTFTRINVTGGTTSGRVVSHDRDDKQYKPKQELDKTTKYANEYVEKFRTELLNRFMYASSSNLRKRNWNELDETIENGNSIYNRYNFNFRPRKLNLPIVKSRQTILTAIQENTAIVLQGPTGCGKTTQVPQFILDDCQSRGKYCNIIVAQPRRIAASSNAKRVCDERGWIVGSIVGYQVGSDKRANCSSDTRILYCTTGVMLEKLINKTTLYPYTHIILDEVHERDKDMDFLMIIIYKYLHPRVKIILMSATIDAEHFANYFQIPRDHQFVPAPIITVECRRNFEVKKYYLDEMEKFIGQVHPEFQCAIKEDIDQPEISEMMYKWALRLIVLFERMDRKDSLEAGVAPTQYQQQSKPSVLVFLPGINEIKELYKRLEKWVHLNQETKMVRIIMHSTVSQLQAELALQQTSANIRKIILATNIAESSITVPDVKYVIDFCLTRNLITDSATNFPSLRLAWASRNNCEQRAGRTGRVMDGKCYRLVSRHFFEREMRQSAVPEIVNSPLENIVLKAKLLNVGSPEEILALAMDKPNLFDIGNTVLRLKEMGALLRTTNGILKELDGDITFIGNVMSKLPIDVKLSKLIIFGYCFSVLDECIIIAAALNCTKSIFKYVSNEAVQSYAKQLHFANGTGSDLFAMLNAYNVWKQLRLKNRFGVTDTEEDYEKMVKVEKQWADRYGLEIASLYECNEYVKDLRVRLKRLKLKAFDTESLKWTDNEKNIVLKVAISGAFYPNYFSRSTVNHRQDERQKYDILDGRDPSDTVYFTGFKNKNFRHIYVQSIKEIFIKNQVIGDDELDKIKIAFDEGSEKVYVRFKKSGKENDLKEYGVACQPGFVLTEVYKSVKMRQMRGMHKIPILRDFNEAHKYASKNGLIIDAGTFRVFTKSASEYENTCLPKALDKSVLGFITHTDNCGRFWFQPKNELSTIKSFNDEMNHEDSDLEPFRNSSEISIGQILAAPFYDTDPRQKEYYRAKVMSMQKPSKSNSEIQYKVFYIDFGNSEFVSFSDLKRFRGVSSQFMNYPPRCFECALAGVQPCQINAPDGIWTKDANDYFRDCTDGKEIEVEIYSIVNGIVRVFIKVGQFNIKDLLIRKNLAERSEESFMSKSDNMERQRAQKIFLKSENFLNDSVVRYLQEEDIPEIPPPKNCSHCISIKGPYSPLEINLFGLTESGKNCRVSIDKFSVNSVLLENEPNDMSEKHLVSASVCQTGSSSGISVRQTTLLPHIRGFGPMMAAIFCPKLELKQNCSKSQYAAMICGLGYDENKERPVYAENDMVFYLDTDINNDDIKIINNIRKGFNSLLYTDPDQKIAKIQNDVEKYKVIRSIKDSLIELLCKPRLMLDQSFESVKWNEYPSEDVIYSDFDDIHGNQTIFPTHCLLSLHPKKFGDLMSLQTQNKELQDLARSDVSFVRSKMCKLCNISIENIVDLRLHLISRLHTDRLTDIEECMKNIFQTTII